MPYAVMLIQDNQIKRIDTIDETVKAYDLAVTLANQQGATEGDNAIRKELKDEGRYIPSKHPDWSVSVAEIEEDRERDNFKRVRDAMQDMEEMGGVKDRYEYIDTMTKIIKECSDRIATCAEPLKGEI